MSDEETLAKVRALHQPNGEPRRWNTCTCDMMEPYTDERVDWIACATAKIVYSAEEIALYRWLATENDEHAKTQHAADQDAWFAKEAAARGWTPPAAAHDHVSEPTP